MDIRTASNAQLFHRLALLLALATVLVVTPSWSAAHAAAPSNDTLVGATEVTALPYSDTVDTREATHDNDDRCGTATVWYSFTPATTASYAVDTYGSEFFDSDMQIGVYDADTSEMLMCAGGGRSYVGTLVSLQAGSTYLIEVGNGMVYDEDENVGPGGDLVFNIDLAPPPIVAEVTVAKRAVVEPGGQYAVVTGTITCSREAYFGATFQLTQKHGMVVQRGQTMDLDNDNCYELPSSWTTRVPAHWDTHGWGTWKARPAVLTMTGQFCGIVHSDCVDVASKQSIKLQR